MSGARSEDLEAVSMYHLTAPEREELLLSRTECVFMWATRDGWPVGVVMSYLWADGRFWLTLGAHRHRTAAVRRDPRVSVCVSNGGSRGGGRTATAKGRAIVHEDRATKDWFYPRFAARLRTDPGQVEQFQRLLDTPLRVVLEVVPEKWITYDGDKRVADALGRLPDEARGPKLSSDTERLQRELERRGLA